eukprot:917582-Alexandrium_andersonii.AAC.1
MLCLRAFGHEWTPCCPRVETDIANHRHHGCGIRTMSGWLALIQEYCWAACSDSVNVARAHARTWAD